MLVNNAGIAASGLFVGANLDSLEKLILLNAVAVMRLAGAVAPGFVARGRGTLINIASVTAMSLSNTTLSPQQKQHWLAEQALNWSGLPVVHVRPTVFLENPFFYGFAVETIRRTGELQWPFGSERSSPIAAQDVARVMAEILISPGDHLGRTYGLTGPTVQDLNGVAEEYSKGLERTVKYRAISWEEWADQYLKGGGLPEHVSNHLATMALRHGENRFDRLTHDVEIVTGMKPMTIREWERVHARTFKGEQ
jgi:NAD(P)H dehydrogenase (quinone)